MPKYFSSTLFVRLLALTCAATAPFASAQTTPSPITGQSGYTGTSITGANQSEYCLDPSLGCMTGMPLNGNNQTGLPVSGSGIGINGYGNGFGQNYGSQYSQQSGNVYVDSAGFPTTNNQNSQTPLGPQPLTDLQRLARESTGVLLPIFGQDLFSKPPSTFAPVDQIPVTPDYVLGPGDEVLLRMWGHNSLNARLTIDRTGSIYIPQVGSVHLSGMHFAEIQPLLQKELSRTYKNFEFSADLGRLRSISVFVMGESRRPGSYTVSALSTAVNAIFASGGPTQQGSLRHIEILRASKVAATLDLYDFLLNGNRTTDIPLQDGDVLFIPFVGPQVAISGAVRHPAIYELPTTAPASSALPATAPVAATGVSVDDLIKLAGGFTSTAAASRLSIERIENHRERRAITIALDAAGLATKVTDGDVLRADSVLRGYRDSVTIRGNLANSGRFPWHPGMRLSEILPDRESLLTPEYWQARNRLGLPTPLFQPAPAPPVTAPTTPGRVGANAGNTVANQMNVPGSSVPADAQVITGVDSAASASTSGPTRLVGATEQRDEVLPSAETRAGASAIAEQQESAADRLMASNARRTDITIAAPEIDWSYAVIERLDANTLRNSLIPFHLGRLVQDHDANEDKELQPGDVITILSQSDIHVAQDEQTKYIRLEGEFGSSGVYSVAPGETLADVVKRAGGLTRNAYLYGASFTRESARVLQQQRLDEYVTSLEQQEERVGSIRAISATTPYGASQTAEERAQLEQLRKLRATGRVVLEFSPNSAGEAAVPAIPLENGDSFRVPSRPAVISVVGSVYGQNVFLWNGSRRLGDYLNLAGKPTRIADKSRSFVIRADGSVLSKQTVKSGLWSNNFNALLVFPGDTIVVPEKPIKPTMLRNFLDYSQVLSQFGVGAAAITVLK
ncbi:SLBB domain-containing protein [Terriglobus roseus]|uniref:Protein involved in polysaccharide export, contains SLBB domain of the beta-grasp fold n=1 Tax=Terriglobus roseus TaxID=392734 RepID=A0A1H4MMV7_9BACT|nr:SLBB domain-containing protein [Terriglobus roseus]SEB84028.1 protein involved in polysaccharide export, contains SLBB domain of the beta-grasp fold [Terriglobus roseus]